MCCLCIAAQMNHRTIFQSTDHNYLTNQTKVRYFTISLINKIRRTEEASQILLKRIHRIKEIERRKRKTKLDLTKVM
ncbi:hypothetical protein AQUCO_05200004v1 [Aquilegia coerulea]|uniref:Uncharacterized protein n=1 Tax=Aquilegia coerulea TaxID=218851 RepID=A0A2G5CJV1_AQUCA|nr:hypothetical protein AQUCO_05200004v1 [Aquilegia coerulea]